jgi:hypothetical protein
VGSSEPRGHTPDHIPRQNLQSYPDTPAHHIPCPAHLIDGFPLNSSLEGRASDTVASHRIKLGRFLGFVGDRPIADISSAEIRQYPGHAKQAYGLSLASVKRY